MSFAIVIDLVHRPFILRIFRRVYLHLKMILDLHLFFGLTWSIDILMIQILASLRIFEWSMEIMLSVPSSTVRWKQIQCIQGGMMNFWNGFKGRQIDLADAEHTNQYHWAFVIKMYKTNYANNYKMRKKKKKHVSTVFATLHYVFPSMVLYSLNVCWIKS